MISLANLYIFWTICLFLHFLPLEEEKRRKRKGKKMKPPLRIAILEADTPPPHVVAEHGAYERMYTTLLQAGADALGQPDLLSSTQGLEISAFDVVTKQEYPDLDKIDAILISGSSRC